jgi:uncharacterized protein YkwD
MKIARRFQFVVLLLCSFTATAAPTQDDALFTSHNAASFRKLPEATEAINSQRVNRALMDAAIFHETNRRRAANSLRPLRYDPKVRYAAAIQSRNMAELGEVTHNNPAPDASSIVERARLAGLPKPAFLAENVASAFARRYRSGEKFYVREENGRKIYSAEPNGPPIPMHTYISFARALVDSWMDSPGHRKNILASEPIYVGCACVRSDDRTAMETFYCTQVFLRPFE